MDDDAGCPGEENCEVWLSSAEPKFCPRCPKLAQPKESDESWEEKQLLDRVERLLCERDSGRAIYKLLTPEEWELMLIWDKTEESYARSRQTAHEMRIEAMFEMLVSLGTVR